jgi:type IV secretion system protein VirD4
MLNITALIVVAMVMFCVLGGVTLLAHIYNLNNIKSKTVGDGQHGTARFSTKAEIRRIYNQIPFTPEEWRKKAKKNTLPNLPQGIIVGCRNKGGKTVAMVDDADVHCMMVGAAGCGKTAYWLYPNLEYACASGMSWLCTDTKGDLYRNYGGIAKDCYGYNVAVIDLRNPTRSDGNNLLHLVNKYMDLSKETSGDVAYRAKAEKYAKIISKTLIYGDGDASAYGQNAFFYDAAEGLMTSVILLIAEFAEPRERHIVSVFKLIQELMAPSGVKGKNQFQLLMDRLPADHKARWFSGAALSTGDQAMASVMSTAMSRLNAFLDSEMEQVLCFDTAIDAEKFCNEKSAVFIVLPEENPNAYFMVSLLIQQLYREILSVADENGGKLPNRAMFYCDEFGTLPAIQSAEMMYSASRSRRLSIVSIIQSYQQLEKNYGREGAAIIQDNCQLTIAGGFAPSSETADIISKALGTRTVMTGSVSRSKNDPSQSLQMTERPLMTADELKSMKKGSFIVMKTGAHPFVSQLKLFMKWGITFPKESYAVSDRGARKVRYISREKLIRAITDKYPPRKKPISIPSEAVPGGQTMTEPVEATPEQEINHAAQQAKAPKPVRTG